MKHTGWNLLILSDLHMGEQEPGESRVRVQQRADILASHFGDFLEYHRVRHENNRPWRLVIAGDMIDFMRIHVPAFETSPLRKSQEVLESEANTSAWKLPPFDLKGTLEKLEQLFAMHQTTFYRLARFLLSGHELVLLTGNHDAELDWPEVQEMFFQHLFQMALREQKTLKPEVLRSKLQFCPRFYYESERIYIEHGHYYDGYCNTSEVASPSNPKLNSFSHVLTSTQFNAPQAFESLPLHHIDQWSALDILSWYARRPLAQKVQLFYEFFAMVFSLIFLAWSNSFRSLLTKPSRDQKQSLERWAEQHKLPVEAIEPLQRFVTPPIHTRLLDTIQALYVDRMALMVSTSFAMTVILVSPWTPEVKALFATLLTSAVVALFQYLSHRRPVSETIPMMFGAALKIAAYLKTPLVVMAHSHHFEQRELHNGQLYINLGAWTVPDELIDTAPNVHGTSHPIQTPPYSLDGVPEYQTTYLMITTTQAPHQFKVCRWPYPHSQSETLTSSAASLNAASTPSSFIAEKS